MTKRVLFFLLLISLLCSSSFISASDAFSTNQFNLENSQFEQMYGYNKNYTFLQWRSLTQAQRDEALQIPEQIFISLETKELLIECATSVITVTFAGFVDQDSPSQGFNYLCSTFKAFNHLMQRPDIIDTIVELYTQQEDFSSESKFSKMTKDEITGYNFFFCNILNVPEIINRFSDNQINSISLKAVMIDQNHNNSETGTIKVNSLYRLASRYNTTFRIDKVYERVARVYNYNKTIPVKYVYLISDIIETQDKQERKETRANIQTRWGQSLVYALPTSNYGPMDQDEYNYYNSYYGYKYPGATKISEPSNRFNCHAYALFSYDGICEYQISNISSASVLNTNDNNYFNKTYSPSTNFPLNYTLIRWGDGSSTNHTGVLYSIYLGGSTGRPDYIGVKSKWGDAGIYAHNVNECQYTGTISYYYRS